MPKPDFSSFFRQTVLDDYADWSVKHPNNEVWLRNQIAQLCRKQLSTATIPLLERLYRNAEDAFARALLAKQMYYLRKQYLQSFKEYSDRALILLCNRENYFDIWEGIYILGCFGGDAALKYLNKRLSNENDPLLNQTIRRSIQKIKINKERKKRQRGF